MSDSPHLSIDRIAAACRDNLSGICDSLNQCFDTKLKIDIGETRPYDGGIPGPEMSEPGLSVALAIEGCVLLCLIPDSLPLPIWYLSPDTSQASRLQTLAMEWAQNCVPDEIACGAYASQAVENLWETVNDCQPLPDAVWLPLAVTDTGADPLSASTRTIWCIWAMSHLPLPSAREVPAAAAGGFAQADAIESWASRGDPVSPPKGRSLHDRMSRLMHVPVTIIVKLAEKKIELSQLLEIGPGAIVTFEKSCEDLLDLHINNKLYCRGEAVKIGEKFGLKINEVGSVNERVSALLGPGS